MHQKIEPLLRDPQALARFNKAIRAQLLENEQRLSLVDLLIEPVQRAPRYLILLNELIKTHQPDDSFQQQHFKQLKMRLSQGLRQINLLMRQHETLINNSLAGEPKLALILALLRYKERRSQRPEFDNFFRRGGVPRAIKLSAAEKAIWILNGHKVTLKKDEFHALTEGRLGRLIKSWSYQVEQDGVRSRRNFFVDEDPHKTAIKELVGLLDAHREKLTVRRSNYSRLDIFHAGYHKNQKITAINKLLRDRRANYELTKYDIDVLQNGTTGKIIREWNKKYHSNAFSLEHRISTHEYLSDDDDYDDDGYGFN